MLLSAELREEEEEEEDGKEYEGEEVEVETNRGMDLHPRLIPASWRLERISHRWLLTCSQSPNSHTQGAQISLIQRMKKPQNV